MRTPGLLDCTTSGGYRLCITYHIWWPAATGAGCGLGLDGPISLASTILVGLDSLGVVPCRQWPVSWSEAEEVCRYQSSRQGIGREGGFLQADHAQQVRLTLFCEYDRRGELQCLQPYGGPADVDRDDPAAGCLRGEYSTGTPSLRSSFLGAAVYALPVSTVTSRSSNLCPCGSPTPMVTFTVPTSFLLALPLSVFCSGVRCYLMVAGVQSPAEN